MSSAVTRVYSGETESGVCSLPFTYKGEEHNACIDDDRDGRYWCATTPDFDQQWGYCEGQNDIFQ